MKFRILRTTKMRALLKDLRPHFIEVLKTPDFRNCEAADDIRQESSMTAQPLLFPTPNYISHNALINRMFRQKSRYRFCNSPKRVSELKISPGNSARLTMISCAGARGMQGDKFDDEHYMKRCIELAKKAIGCTSPNPMVGCVIVKDGKIVGEGFHPKAGQPHAEVFALRDAGDLAENATAYVSLEPCNHYGRTPPCTEALIKAKVKNVVVGMVDPNPIVASTGVKKLQDAGIEVTVGVEEQLCKRLNEAYIHYMLTKTPYVTLRYSMSVDGRILDHLGEEAAECGGYYSKLLQEYDAVILSSAALVVKKFIPISKEVGANQPLKIALSKGSSSLIHDEKISLVEIVEQCKNQGLCSVLMDLRGNVEDFEDIVEEGFEQRLFQKVVVEVLPFLGGGHERELSHINLKGKLKKLTSTMCGESVLLEGYL